MAAATEAAAGRHPDVDFIGADQAHDVSLPNLAGVSFGEDRVGFLAGALAASVTSSRTVAVVLDAEDPTSGDLRAGFANGVAHVDAAVEVVSVTADEGAAAAREAMDAGADVVFAAGARSNADALLEVAAEPGVLCIGVGGDQWYTVSDARPCLVSSARKAPHWMGTGEGVSPFTSVVNMSFGEFAGIKGRVFLSGNRAGMVILAPYHDHKDAVPRDVRDMLEALAKSLLSGDLLACVREDCP
jgi:basic membrane protein A